MNLLSIHLTFALALLNFTTVQGGRVLISLYALKLGADPFVVGILAAMSSVLPTLLSWQVGRLSDRFGSRWPLMFGAAGGALGMLAPYFMPGLPVLYFAAVTNGLLLAFCGVSLQNLVGLLSSRGELSKNFSNFSLMASAANFVGPLLAGFSMMMTFSGSAEGHSGEALGLRVTTNHLARMIAPLVFGMVGAAFGV